ncbi:hypothetical protein CGGC5_v010140 [Colletotrichum fructicola Nara gc5]|uniref:Uncharacterized protein n=1 Tax=Colletotrichum fructicola (strain Nara gc5) TaxID=1213859 RepID=A0A7J6J2U9_COLFN|nr:hypothetical protein CGGC5_v010140 [Colletotrichum fructicola Nara gc5]
MSKLWMVQPVYFAILVVGHLVVFECFGDVFELVEYFEKRWIITAVSAEDDVCQQCFFKFVAVLRERAFASKLADIILFFSDELGEAVTALEAVTEVAIEVSLAQAILALEYFPVRVIRQSTRCASRRQTAKKKT